MKHPRFCDHPEIWWDDWYDQPLIVYPSGRAELFKTNFIGVGFWQEDDGPRRWMDVVALHSDRYKFIAELK